MGMAQISGSTLTTSPLACSSPGLMEPLLLLLPKDPTSRDGRSLFESARPKIHVGDVKGIAIRVHIVCERPNYLYVSQLMYACGMCNMYDWKCTHM